MSISEFAKDRDEALLSLDKEKIIAYFRKCYIVMPKDELVFWRVFTRASCLSIPPPMSRNKEAVNG